MNAKQVQEAIQAIDGLIKNLEGVRYNLKRHELAQHVDDETVVLITNQLRGSSKYGEILHDTIRKTPAPLSPAERARLDASVANHQAVQDAQQAEAEKLVREAQAESEAAALRLNEAAARDSQTNFSQELNEASALKRASTAELVDELNVYKGPIEALKEIVSEPVTEPPTVN